MDEIELQTQIEAAKAYEALFVPALFGQWATTVLDAAQIQTGQRVLDVACGTGVVARAAIARVGAAGHVAGIDPNPGMVALANQLESRVDWRTGVAETLPFPNNSFDAVVSQFGLHVLLRSKTGPSRNGKGLGSRWTSGDCGLGFVG